jgi:hypothetical protein
MPLEAPKLDERTFRELFEETRALIPHYLREWTDHNASDPGITLIELFSWLGETLIYQFNRIPERNYIEFLRLIGMERRPPQPAIAELTFTPVGTDHERVYARTAVEAPGDDGEPVVFETTEAITAVPHTLAAAMRRQGATFEQIDKVTDAAAETTFYPFGDPVISGNGLYLGFAGDSPLPAEELKLAITVDDQHLRERGIGCSRTRRAPAEPVWEYYREGHWRPLAVTRDETSGFMQSGGLYFTGPATATKVKLRADQDDLYWIRAVVGVHEYDRAPELVAIRLNVARAVQLTTVREEIVGSSDGTADQTFRLGHAPVEPGSLELDVAERDTWERWTAVETIQSHGGQEQIYELNAATGAITFGNGRHGRVPLAGVSNIMAAHYRYGGGTRGNVGVGSDEESLDDVKRRAREQLGRGRAVTRADFEELAMQTPGGGIARAHAIPLYHPDFPGHAVPGAVSVIVVPQLDGPTPLPSAHTLERVCAHLGEHRTLTTELFVLPPRYREVSAAVEIRLATNADALVTVRAAKQALLDYYHPLRGGPDGRGWPFGGAVYWGDAFKVVSSIPGVGQIVELDVRVDDVPVARGGRIELDPTDLTSPGLFDVDDDGR